jgi:hypothetical protein
MKEYLHMLCLFSQRAAVFCWGLMYLYAYVLSTYGTYRDPDPASILLASAKHSYGTYYSYDTSVLIHSRAA